MSISTADFKTGMTILYNNAIYQIPSLPVIQD